MSQGFLQLHPDFTILEDMEPMPLPHYSAQNHEHANCPDHILCWTKPALAMGVASCDNQPQLQKLVISPFTFLLQEA
jgi:hypothetical protein